MPDPNEPEQGHDPYDHAQEAEAPAPEYLEKQAAQVNQLASAGIGRALVDHGPPSVTERLREEKKNLELRLQAINELLEQMEANPETQQIIDGMAKLGALGHY